MRRFRPAGALVVLIAACVGTRPIPTLPFPVSDRVESVLGDWRQAGFSCDPPVLGEPGPAIDWYCRGQLDAVDLGLRLTADRHGPQSIIVGPMGPTDRGLAARALGDLVLATSLLGSARPQIAAWLIASGAADGTMAVSSPGPVARVAVETIEPHPLALYVIPAGSSILQVQ